MSEAQLFDYLCRIGDTTLILGHRVSEWCGHAPALEEDIALANVALDLIGQTQMWLGLAAEIEGKGRTADDLAMRRDVWDFRNLLLVEQPNGDFGQTLMRQYLFDAWHLPYLEALCDSTEARIAEIATKSVKEVRYHLRRSRDLVIALGDGTQESHNRMQAALDLLAPYIGEMVQPDALDEAMRITGIGPDLTKIATTYQAELSATLTAATLTRPEGDFAHLGGKTGARHSEHLGHLLTSMQWLQRAYPDASW